MSLTLSTDSNDDLNELILASLYISLQQAKEGKVHPISELWDGIDETRWGTGNSSRTPRTVAEVGSKISYFICSVARDEARPDSDVDLLVEFNQQGGFFQLLQVQYYLEDTLGCSVDLGTHDALKEHLRKPVVKDVINAF